MWARKGSVVHVDRLSHPTTTPSTNFQNTFGEWYPAENSLLLYLLNLKYSLLVQTPVFGSTRVMVTYLQTVSKHHLGRSDRGFKMLNLSQQTEVILSPYSCGTNSHQTCGWLKGTGIISQPTASIIARKPPVQCKCCVNTT